MMNQSTFEQMGGTYREVNGYQIPNLTLPAEENRVIGIWGQRHRHYLKEHHRILYFNLLTSGKLNAHPADVDKRAEEMFSRLIKELSDK